VPRVVDIQTVSIAVASASVVAGVIYYALQLRHQTRIRETDLAIRINPLFNLNAIEFQKAALKVSSLEHKDYADFVKRYGSLSSDTPESLAVHTMLNFSEGVGYLLKRNLVSIDLVYTYYGEAFIFMWERLEPLLEGMTKQLVGESFTSEPCEYLYRELKKRKQQLKHKGV
jgi:hypothetical protein